MADSLSVRIRFELLKVCFKNLDGFGRYCFVVPGCEFGTASSVSSVGIFAAFSYPLLDRAFNTTFLLWSFLFWRRLRFAVTALDYLYGLLVHKSDDVRRTGRAGIFLDRSFSSFVRSSISSPGEHSSATQSFSSVAKFMPSARSFVSRQSVV